MNAGSFVGRPVNIRCVELVFLDVLQHATVLVEEDAVVGGGHPMLLDPDDHSAGSGWIAVDVLVEDDPGSFVELHALTICGSVDDSQGWLR